MPKSVHVHREILNEAQVLDEDAPPLPDGAVLLKVESFAVTSNNITYAAAGDRFGYWKFFPARGHMGIVPVWGHAVVEESAHSEIEVGERIYGYLPMATHLTVVPGKVTKQGFMDSAPHRQPMSPIYNQYSRLADDPEHDPAREAERMLFGPLFKTGFLIESMFRRDNWFGAEAIILTSASSKTAMGLVSVARDRSPDIARIGLTSASNVAFVEASGLYDRVLSYDRIGELDQTPSVSVDLAGNASLLREIHVKLRDALKYSCLVGVTHVQAQDDEGEGRDTKAKTGPEPNLFFAPDHAVAAVRELGAERLGKEVANSWHRFLIDVDRTVKVDVRKGLDAARDAFITMLGGDVDPAQGIVIEP